MLKETKRRLASLEKAYFGLIRHSGPNFLTPRLVVHQGSEDNPRQRHTISAAQLLLDNALRWADDDGRDRLPWDEFIILIPTIVGIVLGDEDSTGECRA